MPVGLALLGLLLPASAAPVETQDSVTEVITARWFFNGTDGSVYTATIAGPSGAELGFVDRNLTLGRGWWGDNFTLDHMRIAYPGNLTLGPSWSANEVFYSRSGAGPRDRDANGTIVWTVGGPTESFWTTAFDADGDGWLDDAIIAYTGVANRYYTYNQAGTQLGQRNLAPGTTNLQDVAAVDTDSNGVLDQFIVGHLAGTVYVERAPANAVWSAAIPANAPVRYVAAFDMNSDSFLEGVLAGADDFSVVDDETVYAYDGTGVLRWTYNTGGVGIVNMSGIEAGGTHFLNGVMVTTNDSVAVLNPAGSLLWNWSANATVTAATTVDFNNDGMPEGVAYGDDTGAITFLDGDGSPVGWIQGFNDTIFSIAAADFDADGWLDEVAAANNTTVLALDATAAMLWNATVGAGYRINMIARADFDGNGTYGDLIVPTTNTLYAYNRSGGLRWSAAEARNLRSASFIENPSAASVGWYLSPELDAGTDAIWTNWSWQAFVPAVNAGLNGSIRFGTGIPGSVTWGLWSNPATVGPLNISGNTTRFVQVRFNFSSANGLASANLNSIRINFSSPALTGRVETPDLSPASTPSWLDFAVQGNLSGGSLSYAYSADAGASWQAFLPGEFVAGANASAPSLRIRVQLDLGVASPNIAWVSVRYAQPGLRPAIASPAAGSTITGVHNISASAAGSITGVSFSFVNLTTNTTVAIGPGAFDSGSGRWWRLWNTSALDGPGFALVAAGTDARGFTFKSARLNFSVDNTAPAVAIQLPLVNAILTGTATLRASASTDAASLMFSYFDGVSINPLGAAALTGPGQWEASWDTSSISELEGVRLFASATDGVGLVGSAQLFPVIVDNLPPTVTITAPAAGSEISGLVNVTINASLDVEAVQIFYNGTPNGNATKLTTPPNATVSQWIVSWDTSQVYFYTDANLTVVATDRAGHTATIAAGPFTINNTQPVPDLVAPLVGSYNTGLVYVAATSPLGTATVEFSYQDRSAALPTAFRTMTAAERNFTTGLWEFMWDTTSPKVDFNGSIILKATSGLGVNGTRSFLSIVVDNTPPTLRFVNPSVGESRLSGTPLIDVQTSSDVMSVAFSYTNASSGENVPVGSFVQLSPFEWALTWDLTNVFVPSATLRAVATDHVGLKAWANFSFVVLGINPLDAPPTIVRAPFDIVLDEDFGTYTLDLTGMVSDDDLANLTTYVDGVDSSVVTVRNNGSKGLLPIYFVSIQDAHSTVQDELRLRFVDASGQPDSALFKFFVQPRNDAPYWTAPPEVPPPATIYVHYDAPYELDFAAYAHDVEHEKEGAPLYVRASDVDHVVQNSSSTTSLIFTFPQSFVSEPPVIVFINLSDGDQTLEPSMIEVAVRVTSDWAPELFRPLPVIYLDEDTPKYGIIDLNDYFVDRDNEAIYYYRGNTNLTFEIADGSVSVTALPLDWSGNQTVFFGAHDATGAFSEARLRFVVAPVNDAPRWDFASGLDISKFYVHYDDDYAFDLLPFVRDVDTPTADLSLQSSSPAEAHSAPGQPLRLVLHYGEAFNGLTQPLVLWVTDGEDRSLDAFFNVSVSSNYPPALVQPFPLEVVITEGEAPLEVLDLSDYFVDPDGVLYFTNGTVHVVVSIVDGRLSLHSNDEWGGTETLIIRAVDDQGSFQQATILVTVLPVDDKPRLRAIPDFDVDAGTAIGPVNLFNFVDDPDTPIDRLVFSARSTYNGVFISIVNGSMRLSYPKYEDANTFDPLQVCVSDGNSTFCRTVAVRINQVTVRPFDWLGLIVVSGAAGIAAIVGARHFIEFKIKRAPTVEDIFLVYEDGILIKHYSKKMRKFADDDVVTSMLSAIQSFAADSFEDTSNWELREITFQGRKILIEKARKFQIYIIFDGDSNEDLKKAIKRSADAIGREYAKALRDWDGDPSHFDGAEKHFKDLLSMEAAFIPEGVRADELVKAPLVPGNAYLSETGNFEPIIAAYGSQLKSFAAVRIRPAPDAGSSIEPLTPDENIIIEVPAPEGVPGEEENGETGLDTTLRAVREAVDEARVAVRGRTPAIFFEGFGFIVDRYGFVFSKKFADQLKRIASSEGCYLFIAVDPGEIDAHQLEGLERDGVVFRGD